MSDSILWTGATLEKDRALVRTLVYQYVGGDTQHKEVCIEKIMRTIKSQAWQEQFSKKNFIFYIHYAMGVNIVEIRTGLFLQAVDALYPYLVPDEKRTQPLKEVRFASKLQAISEMLYSARLNKGVSGAIEVMRNRLLHTASFDGYGNSTVGDDDLTRFIVTKVQTANPGLSHSQCVRFFARSLPSLIGDMTVRALGLEDDDVNRGASSPLSHPWFLKR